MLLSYKHGAGPATTASLVGLTADELEALVDAMGILNTTAVEFRAGVATIEAVPTTVAGWLASIGLSGEDRAEALELYLVSGEQGLASVQALSDFEVEAMIEALGISEDAEQDQVRSAVANLQSAHNCSCVDGEHRHAGQEQRTSGLYTGGEYQHRVHLRENDERE